MLSHSRVTRVSESGKCYIGVWRAIMLPFIVYEGLLNVSLFLILFSVVKHPTNVRIIDLSDIVVCLAAIQNEEAAYIGYVSCI